VQVSETARGFSGTVDAVVSQQGDDVQRRKFERVAFRESAHFQLRGKRPIQGCLVLDVSPGGVGIHIASGAPEVRRGDSLVLTLHTGGNDLEIPGKVAHTQGKSCGIKFHLELAGAATRQAYARWFISLARGVRQLNPQAG